MVKNKTKRIITFLLFVITVMSMLAVNCSGALAVENHLIDSTKKVSLSIYKYELSDLSIATHSGTGEQNDSKYIPADAKLLAGVKFSVKKVKSIGAYFNRTGVALPTVEEAANMVAQSSFLVTTNNQGVAKLSNLPQGIYYVEETDGPVHIVEKAEPFVVALPMTNSEGTNWIYDVYVYPKNRTVYGDAVIKKIDAKTNQILPNAEFSLSKSVDGENYTEVESLKTGSNGTADISSLPCNTFYRVTETKAADDSYILLGNLTKDFFINDIGKMVTDWDSVDSNHKPVNGKIVDNSTLVFSNEKPEIHKFILDKPKGKEGLDYTANIGSVVHWKIRSTIPSSDVVKEMKTYTIVDYYSLGLSMYTCSIFLDDEEELSIKQYYREVDTKLKTITFQIKPEALVGHNEVVIYLDTMLTKKVPIAEYIPNTAKLIYSNTAETTYDIDAEKPTVHTGGYYFYKVDNDGNGIEGAQFGVYASEKDAKEGTNIIQTVTSNAEGLVEIKGLAFGDFYTTEYQRENHPLRLLVRYYWIAELKSGNGKNLLTAPTRIRVSGKSHIASNNPKVINTDVARLPFTGSSIKPITIGFGITSIIIAGLYLFVQKRNRKIKAKD